MKSATRANHAVLASMSIDQRFALCAVPHVTLGELHRRPKIIIWLVVGGVIGWAASAINQSNFSAASLVVSFLGATVLLAIVNLVWRRAAR